MNTSAPVTDPLPWKKSLGWVLVGAVCFNLAYNWVALPAMGWFIFGYALALVQLTRQATVRRAFYWGLATGFCSYAPQLAFFWRIFGAASPMLWIVLAFWVGLFTAIICGATRRWGRGFSLWLIPVVWTGVEYFRSELYYLKFTWLNLGYAVPHDGFSFLKFGMYGVGFLIIAFTTLLCRPWPPKRHSLIVAGSALVCLGALVCVQNFMAAARAYRPDPPLAITGIQLEEPGNYILLRSLDQALARHPDSQIFVLSEYTLEGTVPDNLKNWCHVHNRFLVVGGRDFNTDKTYYNTAYVVGTNRDIVFQQVKSVPIQMFIDGLPAPKQSVWNSPWGKIGICICYDLSYTRVTDELIRQGAQLLIVPTMDVAEWGLHQHELHSRVAPVRAAEYGVPIFRLASSGISQAVKFNGRVIAHTSFSFSGETMTAQMPLTSGGSLPWDRYFAPVCVTVTAGILVLLLWHTWREKRKRLRLTPP